MGSSPFPTPKRRNQPLLSPSSSFSSSSSSLGFSDPSSSPFSPSSTTPLRHRVPFSWEKLPGIPKNQTAPKKTPSPLPLPPPVPGLPAHSKRFHSLNDAVRPGRKSSCDVDPFFAALVECSKDDQRDPLREDRVWKHRNPSDVFGLLVNLNVSCKRTCAVSESIVYLPTRQRAAAAANAAGRRRR